MVTMQFSKRNPVLWLAGQGGFVWYDTKNTLCTLLCCMLKGVLLWALGIAAVLAVGRYMYLVGYDITWMVQHRELMDFAEASMPTGLTFIVLVVMLFMALVYFLIYGCAWLWSTLWKCFKWTLAAVWWPIGYTHRKLFGWACVKLVITKKKD